MRASIRLAALLLLLCPLATKSDEPEADPQLKPQDGPVGQAGDVKRIEFTGLATFSAEQLREALSWDVEFRRAVRPSGSLDKLKEVVDQRLTEGYKAAGFPHTQIDVIAYSESPSLGVFVAEGTRCLCGEVIVSGADDVSATALQEWLATPPAERPGAASRTEDGEKPSSTALWKAGRPAPFSKTEFLRLLDDVMAGLREQGRMSGTVRITVRPQPVTQSAYLIVDAADVGTPAVLNGVELVGLKNNTEADLEDFLELEAGQLVHGAELRRIETALVDSGRFCEIRATAKPAESGEGVVLVLEGAEVEHLPPLSERLNEAQQATLRHVDWLNGLSARDEDIVNKFSVKRANVGDVQLTSIFSPKHGWLATLQGALWGIPLNYGICLTEGRALIYARDSGRKFELNGLIRGPALTLRFRPKFNEEEKQWQSTFTCGAEFSSRDKERAAPILRVSCHRAALFVGTKSATIEDGKLILVSDDGSRTEADAATGRLIAMQFTEQPIEGFDATVGVESGAFQAELARLNKATASLKNVADERHPLSTLAAFLIDESYRVYRQSCWTPLERIDDDVRFNMLVKLLKPLEETLHEKDEAGEAAPDFSIPSAHATHLSLTDATSWLLSASHFLASEYQHGSWPWTIAHEAGLIAAGDADLQSLTELHRLLRDKDTGPIALMLFAAAANSVDANIGRSVAPLAIGVLDDSGKLRSDLETLIPADGKISRCASRMIESLRGLNDDEFEALVKSLPSEWRPVLQLLDEHVRREADVAPREALISLLEASWNRWGREAARQEMLRMAGETPTTRR